MRLRNVPGAREVMIENEYVFTRILNLMRVAMYQEMLYHLIVRGKLRQL